VSKYDVTIRDVARGFGTDLTKKLLYDLYSAFDTPIAHRAKSLLLRDQWNALTALTVNPSEYDDPVAFARDYLIAEIASKVPPSVAGSTPVLLEAQALKKFRESEVACEQVNKRLPLVDSIAFRNLYGHDVREVFCLARDKIHQLLGTLNLSDLSRSFGFGPGATTRLNRSKADLYYKMGSKPHTTLQCSALSAAAVGFTHEGDAVNLWAVQLSEASANLSPLEIVEGCRITTVPKNAKTDRTIAIEPDLNMYVQKGIGGFIRNQLLRVGVDLSDQTHNQRLAKAGSEDGSLATIDLSAASDSVSLKLVNVLLPDDWFWVLNSTRSHSGVFASGDVIRFQKFSSMGNGFTFELESLIFWALSKSVVQYLQLRDRRLGIYGDDIIISTKGFDLLKKVLNVAGFNLNAKKTFSDGPFRESCGKHYFRGVDVTPFYLRKEVNHAQPLFVAVNNLRRWLFRVDGVCYRPLHYSLYRKWIGRVPRRLRRFRGPDGYGDDFLICNFEEAYPSKAENGWEGWTVDRLILRTTVKMTKKQFKRHRVEGPPLLLKSLYRLEKKMLEEGADSDVITQRCNAPDYRIKKDSHVHSWPGIGFPLATPNNWRF
jgi:hypothetical protein